MGSALLARNCAYLPGLQQKYSFAAAAGRTQPARPRDHQQGVFQDAREHREPVPSTRKSAARKGKVTWCKPHDHGRRSHHWPSV